MVRDNKSRTTNFAEIKKGEIEMKGNSSEVSLFQQTTRDLRNLQRGEYLSLEDAITQIALFAEELNKIKDILIANVDFFKDLENNGNAEHFHVSQSLPKILHSLTRLVQSFSVPHGYIFEMQEILKHLGKKRIIFNNDSADIYLSHKAMQLKHIDSPDRQRVEDAMRAAIDQISGQTTNGGQIPTIKRTVKVAIGNPNNPWPLENSKHGSAIEGMEFIDYLCKELNRYINCKSNKVWMNQNHNNFMFPDQARSYKYGSITGVRGQWEGKTVYITEALMVISIHWQFPKEYSINNKIVANSAQKTLQFVRAYIYSYEQGLIRQPYIRALEIKTHEDSDLFTLIDPTGVVQSLIAVAQNCPSIAPKPPF